MSEGWGVSAANGVLLAVFGNTSYVVSAIYVQLHVGPPGAAGTSNVAANNTRMDVSGLFDLSTDGTVANTAIVGPWTNVPATETYTHWSLWSASSAGDFLVSGVITGDSSVTAGDEFQAAPGSCTASLPLAS